MSRLIFALYWGVWGIIIAVLFVGLMSSGSQQPFSQNMPFIVSGCITGFVMGALFIKPFRRASKSVSLILISLCIALLAWPFVGLFSGLIIQWPEVAAHTLSAYDYFEKSIILAIITSAFGIGTFLTVIGWIYLVLVIAAGFLGRSLLRRI